MEARQIECVVGGIVSSRIFVVVIYPENSQFGNTVKESVGYPPSIPRMQFFQLRHITEKIYRQLSLGVNFTLVKNGV